MSTATLNPLPTITATATLQCKPWCVYQDCWQDPAASAADGITCISTERTIRMEGPQPLAAGAWPTVSLYLGPDTTQRRPNTAVLMAYGDNQSIYLTPAKARELAAALTSLAALAEGQ